MLDTGGMLKVLFQSFTIETKPAHRKIDKIIGKIKGFSKYTISMAKKESELRQSDKLRKQAEELLAKRSKCVPVEFADDVKSLIHELHVHQVELEMQNEELRKAQQKIEESRTKYVDLYDFAPVGYFTLNKDGLILDVNLTGADLLGVERHFLIHKPIFLYIVDEFRSLSHSYWRRVFLTGSKQTCELKLMKKNGAPFYASVESIVVQDSNGDFQCRSIINDISDYKRMEAKLRESHQTLELLMEYVPEGLTIADAPDVTIRKVSKYIVHMIGHPPDVVEGVPLKDLGKKWNFLHSDGITPATPEELPLTRATKKGETVTNEDWIICRSDGEKITVLCNAGPIRDHNGTITGGVAVWRDITERKRINEELKKYRYHLEALVETRTSELKAMNAQLQQEVIRRKRIEEELEKERHFLKAILDSIEVGVVACDSHGILTFFNRATREFHGLCEEPIPADTWAEHYDLYLPDGKTKMDKENIPLFRALRDGSVHNAEMMIIPKNGVARLLLASGQAIVDRQGKKLGAVVAMHDITRNRQIEEALRMSESKYRMLIENLPERIFYKDKNFMYVSCNENLARDLHIKPDEIKGKTDYDLFPEKLAEKYRADDKRVMESGQTGSTHEKYIKDGRELIVWMVRSPVKDEKGTIIGILGSFYDITEKITLQREAERSRHLASLGELAAGVGHEINNPVTGVINCAQILFNKSSEGSKEKDLASRIIKEGNRIARIVHSLLFFATPSDKEKKKSRVNIHQLMSDTLVLTEAQLRKEGVQMKLDIPPKLPEIIADPHQIQQVFLNIINNARYALNQKHPETHDNKILEISGKETTMDNRPSVKITFYDHGTGIPAEIQDKVVDPFFTTKPRGIGTGLGLSISHGIIKDHGGKLIIDSLKGVFTRVVIIFPAASR